MGWGKEWNGFYMASNSQLVYMFAVEQREIFRKFVREKGKMGKQMQSYDAAEARKDDNRHIE